MPNHNKHLFHKIQSLISIGISITYQKIFDGLSEDEAWLREVQIEDALRGQEIELCNIARCGKGGNTWDRISVEDQQDISERLRASRPKRLTESWKRNISLGLVGTKHSEESKRKRSEKLKGENNPMYGKSFSSEALEKIRKSSIGRVASDAKKEKCRIARLGKTHTLEAKEKCRVAKLGIPLSEKTRRKMSESHRGKSLPKEHREKIAEANRGKVRDESTRLLISSRAKLRTGSKNSNYRPMEDVNIKFILENREKSINWIVTHLPIKCSRGKVERFLRSQL